MSRKNQDVDAYIADCPEVHRDALIALHTLIHKLRPTIVESIQYNMPVFSYNGAMLCSMSSRKNYISLYCRPEVVDGHRQALGKLNVGKGCLRFHKLEQISLDTVRAILEETLKK